MGYRSLREGIPLQEFCGYCSEGAWGYKCGGHGNNDKVQRAWDAIVRNMDTEVR